MLRRFAVILMPLALTWAGGFFLTIHDPASAGQIKDAVLTVKAQGCHDYSKSHITGVAEGVVNGKRQTVTLDLLPTGTPGTFAVRKQWPAEGKWVLVFSGTFGEARTNTIAELGPDGQWRPHMNMRAVTPAEIEASLR